MQYVLRDIDLGGNIARVRLSRGLTQEQVVARMQLMGSTISRATYSKIETGTRNIKASDLLVLSLVLNVKLEVFFQREESKAPGA
ncbi:MAG: helix-turn-helix transcriptional regulator [Clostridia bacterium]|nr:helix-turn-helix transcriptional regulator [Clostridia bacterium]